MQMAHPSSSWVGSVAALLPAPAAASARHSGGDSVVPGSSSSAPSFPQSRAAGLWLKPSMARLSILHSGQDAAAEAASSSRMQQPVISTGNAPTTFSAAAAAPCYALDIKLQGGAHIAHVPLAWGEPSTRACLLPGHVTRSQWVLLLAGDSGGNEAQVIGSC
jgi:hypothetical protein